MGSDAARSDFGAFVADPGSLFDGVGLLLLFAAAAAGIWLVLSARGSSPTGSTGGSLSPLLDLAGLTRDIAPKLQALDASLTALGVGIEDRAGQIERHLADAIVAAKSRYVAAATAAAKANRPEPPPEKAAT